MKLLFEAEDCLIGIGIGLLMIGLSGKYFSVPEWPYLWAIAFFISFLFTIFDVVHTFSDISGHISLMILLIINNVADAIIEIALTAKFFGLEIPTLSAFLNPYFNMPGIMFAFGIFFIISSVFWLIAFPFME